MLCVVVLSCVVLHVVAVVVLALSLPSFHFLVNSLLGEISALNESLVAMRDSYCL